MYVSVDSDDDEEDMVYFWKLYSCAFAEVPVKVGEKGESTVVGRSLKLANKWL